MSAPNVALVTAREWFPLVSDDQLLAAAIEKMGVRTQAVLWDDPEVDWKQFAAVLIRSPWDYSWRYDEFLEWILMLEKSGTVIWNSPEILRQNANKRYLRVLEAAEMNVVPTEWVWRGEPPYLQRMMKTRQWEEVVIKPVISAGARNTWRVSASEAAAKQEQFASQLKVCDLMIQPFKRQFIEEGEWSVIFFENRFSHAVVKTPAAGEWRFQVQYGGVAREAEPPHHVLSHAQLAMELLGSDALYVRVDGVEEHGRFLITEVEMLEPRLFLAESPGSEDTFATAIIERLGCA